MTEREFEQRLRAFYRAEAARPVPADLWDEVLAISEQMPRRAPIETRRGFVLLAAAAMLAALLVAGAIAIGFGLVKVPWLPDDDANPLSGLSSEILGPLACDPWLPAGLAMLVETHDQPGSNGPIEIFVYEDGRVFRGPMSEDIDGSMDATAPVCQWRPDPPFSLRRQKPGPLRGHSGHWKGV